MLRAAVVRNGSVPGTADAQGKTVDVAPWWRAARCYDGDDQDELGLIDSRYRPAGYDGGKPAGATMYWQVDDVPAAVDRLVALGATELEPPTERDQGWVTATVADPFDNVLGLMYSPHYLKIHERSH